MILRSPLRRLLALLLFLSWPVLAGGPITPPAPIASTVIAGKVKCDGVTTVCAADGTITATTGGTAGINQLTGDVTAGAGTGAQAATVVSAGGKALTLGGAFSTAAALAIGAGTSGGIPYYSSATGLTASATLTANLPVLGGGAGGTPVSGARSGNTTTYVTSSGTLTSGVCAEWDASGNAKAAASGLPCGSGGTPALTSAHLFVGNGSNVATDVTLSGDASLLNTGALTVTRLNGNPLGSTSVTSGNVLLANGSSWISQVISSDATINGSGQLTIGSNIVTNAKAAQMAAHTFKGNNTSSTGNAVDMTVTQATAELNNVVGDTGTGGTKGLVPAAAAGDAAAGKFLKADGTFAVPPGAAGCPSNVTTWDGTANLTVPDATGLVYTIGSTPIAAARTLFVPTVALYTIGCRLRVVDLAGIFNATHLVTPTRQSSDTIDGGTTATTLGVAGQSVAYTPTAATLWATDDPPSILPTTCATHQFIFNLPASGIPGCAQPAFSDVSGTATASQLALTSASIIVGNGSNIGAGVAMSGDAAIDNTGAITVSKTQGSTFAASATTDTTNASNITVGTLSVNRFNSGSGATSSTFLNGVGQWATPAGGGGGGSSGGGPVQHQAAYSYVTYQPGHLTAVSATKALLHKAVVKSYVDAITGSAIEFSCAVNPVITFFSCSDTTCSSAPTTLGTVTLTTTGTAVDGTVSSQVINQGNYIAASMTAGTCANSNLMAGMSIHTMPTECGYLEWSMVDACNSALPATL